MKFKENAIKPGMVIHCPTKKDVEALMTHLKDIGYVDVYYMVDKYSVYGELTCYKMCRTYDGSLTAEYSPIRYYRDDCCYEITEFSDLIEPKNSTQNSTDSSTELSNAEIEEREWVKFCEEEKQSEMSAEEVLEWLRKAETKEFEKLFSCGDIEEMFDYHTNDEIIRIITAYEAAKKAPKPMEVEWVDICRIIQIQDNGLKRCVYEEVLPDNDGCVDYQNAENILKKYISEHEGRYIAVNEGICRVKEDE